ncbi:L-lactate transporter [Methylobacterium crusticola]|uniref:L-lactate transporter n=1 Tax=Methylobacterium crusticola TaxID=1697972 RepID=A0ABQ4QSE5_9HYPH|nr:MFS transporter [Methylobacterium crusticola]GJD47810.1 L-lactate transporter [Methylobacterium crusticola]
MADSNLRSPSAILACGGLILALSLGLRHGFGLFLQPISMDSGWGREVFAFAIALQNLIWGTAQPFTGMLADRIGAGRVILGGAALYVAGLVLMAQPQGAAGFVLSAGLLVGLGLSGTTFPIVFGAVSRAMPPEQRSLAMGVAMAVGSFGQFVMLPGTFGLMEGFGWSGALIALSILCALIVPLSYPLLERTGSSPSMPAPNGQTIGEALREALGHMGFWLLSLGFFVCGFQVVFIAVHLPAFLADKGLPTSVATTVLALIGLVNVAGTYYAGLWGGRYSKPRLLVWIYLGRAVSIALFVLLPITTWSAYAFGVTMGLFWLSTVPLTNGLVAGLFGVKNMSMLAGIVFLAHQVGGFLGGWLGGYLYDRLGSYDAAWGLAIGLSLVAALLNLPIREEPVVRLRAVGSGT